STFVCRICGACWRRWQENVIQFDDITLTIAASRCTGCGGCAAVCPHQALLLRFDVDPYSTRDSAAYTLSCDSCKSTFHALSPE
ncbi:4Fe-4S binding protein, partial [Salmonella enterica subsp. enterica serovar Kentucky]|uniref:4Fe-4S binding protein n=1 Tax=Salmonella enterica TaxID=28901 RepID=UPI003F4C2973